MRCRSREIDMDAVKKSVGTSKATRDPLTLGDVARRAACRVLSDACFRATATRYSLACAPGSPKRRALVDGAPDIRRLRRCRLQPPRGVHLRLPRLPRADVERCVRRSLENLPLLRPFCGPDLPVIGLPPDLPQVAPRSLPACASTSTMRSAAASRRSGSANRIGVTSPAASAARPTTLRGADDQRFHHICV